MPSPTEIDLAALSFNPGIIKQGLTQQAAKPFCKIVSPLSSVKLGQPQEPLPEYLHLHIRTRIRTFKLCPCCGRGLGFGLCLSVMLCKDTDFIRLVFLLLQLQRRGSAMRRLTLLPMATARCVSSSAAVCATLCQHFTETRCATETVAESRAPQIKGPIYLLAVQLFLVVTSVAYTDDQIHQIFDWEKGPAVTSRPQQETPVLASALYTFNFSACKNW